MSAEMTWGLIMEHTETEGPFQVSTWSVNDAAAAHQVLTSKWLKLSPCADFLFFPLSYYFQPFFPN